jgi:preprotein translocase SecE subunit
MAYVTQASGDRRKLVDDKARAEAPVEKPPEAPKPAPKPAAALKTQGGFFTIYKKGQGYWTRMGTLGGAALIGLWAAFFLYYHLRVWLLDANNRPRNRWIMGITILFLAVYSLIAWVVMNRKGNVQFLIETDSEMKKVNWTSKQELIGSTKVVIGFMFLTAAFLFVMDLIFGSLFYYLDVLKVRPF